MYQEAYSYDGAKIVSVYLFRTKVTISEAGTRKGLKTFEQKGAAEGAGARTVVPATAGYYFTLLFTAPGKTSVNETLSGSMSLTIALEPAVWTLEVRGYTDSTMGALKVTGSISVPISTGSAAAFDVYLTPNFSSGGTGTLAYNISFPASVSRAFFGLYPLEAPGTSQEINMSTEPSTGSLTSLPEGSYRAVIDLYDGAGNRAAARTEAVHIYDGLSTSLTRGFAAADFANCPPVIGTGETTLEAKLDAALASPSGAYTIVLDGPETDLASFEPKDLEITTGNTNIAITLRGNGETVQPAGTEGTFFYLEAASGSSLSLALHDLTLRGRSGNNAPVVVIRNRGTLLMKAGFLITGNISSLSNGGVAVHSGGTLSMNGGAVSDNTGSGSGGVSIQSNGTFNMSGGAVSGNTSGSATAGGVLVTNDGTFSMSGGAVNGNITTSADGGVGIYNNGTFIMSGGAVSGNAASYGGGGVGINNETFIMR
jgi:hypothetical protein